MAKTTERPIWARGLAKRFGDVEAVGGIDLHAEPGTCLGLLGPNGAGKTTTIEMLEGLQAPDAGVVNILGLSWEEDAEEIRERIGVQLQDAELPEKLRVFEAVRLFRGLYQKGRDVEAMLDTVGLSEKRTAFVSDLSGGQRQRLSLACALVHEPDVLFLDEPTTGLDPQGRRKLWEIVEGFKQDGGTVLLTTHFMEEAERLADRLLIIDHGQELREGTPAEIVASLEADRILDVELGGTDGDGPPDAFVTSVGELSEVSSVHADGGRVKIGIERFERALPEILRLAEGHDLSITDLGVHRPTLEDVFVSLTGRGLRDA